MNIRETAPRITELEKISTRTDTRDYLAKAAPTKEKLKDWLIVDVDAHVNETAFWSEVTDRIDNEVLRYIAEAFRERGRGPGLLNANGPLYQDVSGRIMHQQNLSEPTPPGLHRQVQLTQRAMDALGIDYMVVFPTPMLSLGMHSLSFVHFNMIHMTNWVLNGLPERFPGLKVIWIESGLAWVPFVMQRLDSEYMMRTSECPLLKRKPSEYIQDMYFTSQPLERSNMKLTQATFEAIRAETQLLYASDWPHWDFDAPSSITKLPFLKEDAKRNILGLNAAQLFGLEVPAAKSGVKASPQRVAVPAE